MPKGLMRGGLPVLSLLLAFAGCAYQAQYWAKPGGTQAAFETASASCGAAAARQFPPMTFGRPGFYPNLQTECEPTAGGTNCIVIGSGYLPQARAANDTNEGPRAQAFQGCLMAQGWRPVGFPLEGTVWGLSDAGGNPVSETRLRAALVSCDATFRRRRGSPERTADGGDFNQCVVERSRVAGLP